jgi:tripartite-type tricarboxylate transporter receptor subunit TctC
MNRLILRAALGTVLCFGGHVHAQTYPAGPVRIEVLFPAGGGVD